MKLHCASIGQRNALSFSPDWCTFIIQVLVKRNVGKPFAGDKTNRMANTGKTNRAEFNDELITDKLILSTEKFQMFY